jgi:transcriptional regulator with XRE-family HTH domain
MMTQASGVVNNWRVRMHDLIAKGVAAARQRRRWTQEQAAREFRAHGLTTWRTSAVSQLEAGLRRPRFDEVLLMAAALDVSLEELIPGDDEQVELGDGATMTPRAIRALLRDFDEFGKVPVDDIYFPGDARLAELYTRSKAEEALIRPRLEPIVAWAKRRGVKLTAGDWQEAFGPVADPERHAARRLGVLPAEVKFAAWVLWHQDFAEQRDARIEDANEIEPRSLQARRGIVTRAMLRELRTFLTEAEQEAPPHGK